MELAVLLENKRIIFFMIYEILKEVDTDNRYMEYEKSTFDELLASFKTRKGYKNLVKLSSLKKADYLVWEMAWVTLFYVKYGPDGVERAWAAFKPHVEQKIGEALENETH